MISLDQLVAGLHRFVLKPKLHKSIRRDCERIEGAWQAWQLGETQGGSRWSAIARAGKLGGPDAAQAAYEGLLSKAKGRAKRDLRLWAPALYKPGTTRHSENVLQVSCLVLDYDSGIPIEEASGHWAGFYHVVHTTWSHRPDFAKFRLCLPLRNPVLADDWRQFWEWAAHRVGMKNDPALKSASATFALPALGSSESPHRVFVRGGRLLDAVEVGVLKRVAPAPPELPSSGPNHWNGDDPDYRFLEYPREPRRGFGSLGV